MSNQAAKPVLIQAEKLADGVTSTSRPGQAILVQDGRISAVGDFREIQRQVEAGFRKRHQPGRIDVAGLLQHDQEAPLSRLGNPRQDLAEHVVATRRNAELVLVEPGLSVGSVPSGSHHPASEVRRVQCTTAPSQHEHSRNG